MKKKSKIMLHIIMPEQISGPNIAAKRISESYLSKKYDFGYLIQSFHAGGKINIKLIKDLKRQINDFTPDIIHLSGLQSSGFHAASAAHLAGYKNILLTIRGFSSDKIGISRIKRRIYNMFENITLKLVNQFTTVCEEAAKKKLVTKNIRKFAGTIHNPAPSIDSQLNSSRNTLREEFAANEKDILIATSGRMVYDKGISFISEAIKNMDLSNKKFIFIGDGEYCDILKTKHENDIRKKKVFILGKRNDVLKILTACDIFLFTTLHENLSNALLEACAVGLPVVATKVGGNVEVIQEGINGYLIEPENPQEICEKIEKLSRNEKLRLKFGSNSKKIMAEEFSQHKIYSKLDELYQKYLKADTNNEVNS